MNRVRSILFLLLFLISSLADCSNSESDNDMTFLSITFENDVFLQEDGGYTNGIGASWGKGVFDRFTKDNTPDWLHWIIKDLYINTMNNKYRGISYGLAHLMQTPQDIETSELVEDEPPYAGLLIGRATLYAFDEKQTDRLTLAAGVVGPMSGAEEAQKFIHKTTNGDDPKGWNHQLKNEPVFLIQAERSWRNYEFTSKGVDFDIISTVSGSLGNLQSDVGAAGTIRFGSNLLESFPTASIMPGHEVNPMAGTKTGNWSLFTSFYTRYVFNSLYIEGNTFRESHGVELNHEQWVLSYGLSVNLGRWSMLFASAESNKWYEGQKEDERFGTVSATYRF